MVTLQSKPDPKNSTKAGVINASLWPTFPEDARAMFQKALDSD
jgi:hypothetical protein